MKNKTEKKEPETIRTPSVSTDTTPPSGRQGYEKTDDLQWCRKSNEKRYDLIEVRYFTDKTFQVVTDTIDLLEQPPENQAECIKYFYKDLAQLKSNYPKEGWNQIIAECIFESEPDSSTTAYGPFNSENEAEQFVLKALAENHWPEEMKLVS